MVVCKLIKISRVAIQQCLFKVEAETPLQQIYKVRHGLLLYGHFLLQLADTRLRLVLVLVKLCPQPLVLVEKRLERHLSHRHILVVMLSPTTTIRHGAHMPEVFYGVPHGLCPEVLIIFVPHSRLVIQRSNGRLLTDI